METSVPPPLATTLRTLRVPVPQVRNHGSKHAVLFRNILILINGLILFHVKYKMSLIEYIYYNKEKT